MGLKLNSDLNRVKERKAKAGADVTRAVQVILQTVQTGGDEAVRRYAKQFDGYDSPELPATREEIETAVKNTEKNGLLRIIKRAIGNIKEYHEHQKQNSWSVYKDNGVLTGQIVRPLKRVALYVPGGTAAYPSTVLMCAVPALLAGVEDISIFTPVKAGKNVSDEILAAAHCLGIEKVYKIGGVHGIAAAAFGTETIPRADKIVGPGNIYVATAKRLVYGEVDIDMVAGPSEILIIADSSANPAYIAADMMSQAEHDLLASSVLLCTDEKLIHEVEKEIDKQVESLSRKEIVLKSLSDYGAAVLVKNLDEAFAISNDFAPEHLEILTENPLALLPKVENAGSIFLGEYSPEPLGDYMSGTNHVLPTGGTARFYSPLGVYDFVKSSAYSFYPKPALAEYKDDVAAFANAEGLDAHANAVKVRFL